MSGFHDKTAIEASTIPKACGHPDTAVTGARNH